MSKERNINTLLLDGGCHSLNFINTIHSRTEEQAFDYLKSYYDLLDWCSKVRLLPNGRINRLKNAVQKNETKAESILKQIKGKREVLHQVFSSLINKKKIDSTAEDEFNESLSNALSNLAFKFEKGKINLGWQENGIDLFEPIWIIFKDAFDILNSIQLNRIKECRSCGWLFLDKSKNNSRAWCNMQTCGSIDKSKRYYRKKKKNIL